MDETPSWENGISPISGTDYYLEQDANDKNILYLTLKKDFLERLDGTGTKISPSLTLKERKSGRIFGTYSVPALVNSAPPAVIHPVVLCTGGTVGDETYVICFNLPEMTGIHQDVKTLKISSPYERTYTVNTADGTLSGGGTELTKIYGDTWKPVKEDGAGFKGDKNNRFVGIVTDVLLSDNLTTFTLTLTDSSGLSTSVTASTQASELPSVTASPKGGTIKTDGTVTFTSHVSGAGIVLTSDNWDGVEEDGTPVPGKIEGIGTITLTFTKPGTYNITAYAQMDGAADSDKVIFTYKVVDDSTVYVSEFGDNNNPGTEDKPVATLQKALELLNDAGFTEGKIVVTGTVQTREVKINAPGDSTTGSVTTLTVRGGSAGGTLKNEKGRVFNITGGSVTLGDGITLTGTVTGENARGGAVYVTGGNFTMESGSTIADSSVQGTSASGGGVYVMNGTFIMEDGSKITGSSATISGGGVAVSTDGIFTMRGGTIDGAGVSTNAESGGGVEIYDARFTMEGGTITGNNATYGGGVRVDSGEFIMKDGIISDNNATELGGGVCVINGSFTMSDTAKIQGNTATTGGGVFVNAGNFTMTDGTISGNNATSGGGGVYVGGDSSGSSTFTMSGGTIGGTDAGSANTAGYGGGVYVYNGTFEMSDNAKIQGNEATGTEAVDGGGGGVYVNGGKFSMEGSAVISSNNAVWQGGGVCVGSNANGIFTMTGGTIGGSEGNCSNTAQFGGGVYMKGGEFTMSGDASISGNDATVDSGGVGLDSGKFTMSGGTISGNNAINKGGGVCVINSGTFTMSGGTIGGDEESDANTASDGGGVYMNGSFTVRGGTIQGQDNKNEIYSCKTFTITGEPIIIDCTVILANDSVYINVDGLNENAALTNVRVNHPNYKEGTTLLENAGSKDICDKFALNNIPKNNGIWWIGLDDIMKNGILCNISDVNDLKSLVTAAGSGGKVEITGGGDIVVDTTVSVPDGADVTIKPGSGYSVNITASGETTVFDVQADGSLTLGGENSGSVIITGDSSVGNPYNFDGDYSLITVSGGTVNIGENTEIKDNKAGRGVNMTSGNLYMTGGTISDNTGNTNGGGVLVNGANSNFIMSGGEICNNKLEKNSTSDPRQGGGVRVSGGATFTLKKDGKIYSNEARDGGGVGVDSSTFRMEGGEIYENVATSGAYGGGVYVQSSGEMYMSGGKIYLNSTSGVYLSGSSTFVGSPYADASISDHTGKDISYPDGATVDLGNVTTQDPINP